MKPIAIFRHTSTEGPGYFATFIEARRIPWTLITIDAGDPVPGSATEYSGLVFMGGPMSVNDRLAWVEAECALIRDAVNKDIPVLGHCLGGQLMSKALGGSVTRNPAKEIGWGPAHACDHPLARHWLGTAADTLTVFQWHGETFSIPEGATRIAGNAWCANQMFVLGPHLGMQCHVEMTPELIRRWCEDWALEVAGLASLPACVQTPQQMLGQTTEHLPQMRTLADRLYTTWCAGLRPD